MLTDNIPDGVCRVAVRAIGGGAVIGLGVPAGGLNGGGNAGQAIQHGGGGGGGRTDVPYTRIA